MPGGAVERSSIHLSDGGWWKVPALKSAVPPGLDLRGRMDSKSVRHCLTKQVRLTMLGDSVSRQLCRHAWFHYSPDCCMPKQLDPPGTEAGKVAPFCSDRPDLPECVCVQIEVNEIHNKLVDLLPEVTRKFQLPEASTLDQNDKRPRVLVLNIGLWDASFGNLSYYTPGGKYYQYIEHVQREAAMNGFQRFFWRTVTSVDRRNFAEESTWEKLAYLNQPRVEEMNRLVSIQAARAGFQIVDVALMTSLRPDLYRGDDMRHFKDEMYEEMLRVIAKGICPT